MFASLDLCKIFLQRGKDMKNQMEERSIKQVLLRSKINGQMDFVI